MLRLWKKCYYLLTKSISWLSLPHHRIYLFKFLINFLEVFSSSSSSSSFICSSCSFSFFNFLLPSIFILYSFQLSSFTIQLNNMFFSLLCLFIFPFVVMIVSVVLCLYLMYSLVLVHIVIHCYSCCCCCYCWYFCIELNLFTCSLNCFVLLNFT